MVKKQNKLKYFIIAIIVIVIYFLMVRYPAGKIVEDRPVLKILCEMYPFQDVGGCGNFICDDETDYTFKLLENWSGYNGCNESTKGYKDGKIYGLTCCNIIPMT